MTLARPSVRVSLGIEHMHQFVARMNERLALHALSREEVLEFSAHLHDALDEVHALYDAVFEQSNHLGDVLAAAQAERERYRQLFDEAPQAYLVTDVHGTIREGNPSACLLLNTPGALLPGTPLAAFVEQSHRLAFCRDFIRLVGVERVQDWLVPMVPHNGPGFLAALSMSGVSAPSGDEAVLPWMILDVTDGSQVATIWTLKQGSRQMQCTVSRSVGGLEMVVITDGTVPQIEVFPTWPDLMRRCAAVRNEMKTAGWSGL